MITLILDSSSSPSGVAVTKDGSLLAETIFSSSKTLSKRLLPSIFQTLENAGISLSQVDLFVCSTGPGSFTGIRTGIATIQGLALANSKPCIGVSTLAMLAGNIPWSKHPVCAMLDARKEEVYTGIYDCSPTPVCIMADRAIKPSSLLDLLEGTILFVGEGAFRYRQLIEEKLGKRAVFAPDHLNTVRPVSAALLAETAFTRYSTTASPEQLLPNYLRLSEAELLKQLKNPSSPALS